MKQYLEDIRNHIKEADLVVVGLGDEWNVSPAVKNSEQYQRIMADLTEKPEYQWILPYVYYRLTDESLLKAYRTLFGMLEGKNYYVVATTVNRSFLPFVKEDRAVMPCGSDACMEDEVLSESDNYKEFLQGLTAYINGEISLEQIAFVQDNSGNVIPFNSVYAGGY